MNWSEILLRFLFSLVVVIGVVFLLFAGAVAYAVLTQRTTRRLSWLQALGKWKTVTALVVLAVAIVVVGGVFTLITHSGFFLLQLALLTFACLVLGVGFAYFFDKVFEGITAKKLELEENKIDPLFKEWPIWFQLLIGNNNRRAYSLWAAFLLTFLIAVSYPIPGGAISISKTTQSVKESKIAKEAVVYSKRFFELLWAGTNAPPIETQATALTSATFAAKSPVRFFKPTYFFWWAVIVYLLAAVVYTPFAFRDEFIGAASRWLERKEERRKAAHAAAQAAASRGQKKGGGAPQAPSTATVGDVWKASSLIGLGETALSAFLGWLAGHKK